MQKSITVAGFRDSAAQNVLPDGLTPALRALWEDARGNWSGAHAIAQDLPDATGSWIHAYLHRKEGDHGNAAYWYRRAGQPVARDTLDQEWDRLVSALL